MRAPALAAVALLAACAPATPEEPTWLEDVRPILVASCVRCHGYPPIGGAPGTFRLDRYDDDFIEGQTVRGAATMAPFIAARASERGDMPPRGALLSSRQKDVLARWATTVARGARPGNRPPTATLLAQTVAGQRATLVVELDDPDGDLAFGTLLERPLRPGRQTVTVDLAERPAGALPLVASRVSDDEVERTVDLGTLEVPAKASAPPQLIIDAPERDDILRGTVNIVLEVRDPDGPPPTVTVEARRGGERRPVEIRGAILEGPKMTIPWDTSALPEATNWRLHVAASDGATTVEKETHDFIITRASTGDRYADVQPLLDTHCARCHWPIVDRDTMAPDFSRPEDIRLLAGLAWRKVVQLREMPPPSADLVLEPPPAPLSEGDRARLGAWLLAGAPP